MCPQIQYTTAKYVHSMGAQGVLLNDDKWMMMNMQLWI